MDVIFLIFMILSSCCFVWGARYTHRKIEAGGDDEGFPLSSSIIGACMCILVAIVTLLDLLGVINLPD